MLNGLTNAPKNARVLPIEVQPFEHTIAVLQYPTLKHMSKLLDSSKTREDSGLVYKWSGNLSVFLSIAQCRQSNGISSITTKAGWSTDNNSASKKCG
jgi:hypothetical protein